MSYHEDQGISNPATSAEETHEMEDDQRTNSILENLGSNCLQFIDGDPRDEYDEGLAIPDSMTLSGIIGSNSVAADPDANGKSEDGDSSSSENMTRPSELPYTHVYDPPVRFNSIQRKVFIPGVPIHVEILDYERQFTSHFLNPNLYTIQLTHGSSTWTIKKRYKDFASLHQQLRLFRASLNFPLPTKNHREIRHSFRHNPNISVSTVGNSNTNKRNSSRKRKKGSLPRFPNKPDALVPFESIPIRIRQLEQYLYNLLGISLYREHHDTISFLEVSHLSFISALGEKGKEGKVKKRTGSTHPGQSGCNLLGCLHGGCCIRCSFMCSDMCGKFRDRWLFVKETYYGLIRPKDGVVRTVVLFDQGFDISSGMYNMGMRNGIQVTTDSRYMVLKCPTRRIAKEWTSYFKMIANNSARDFTMPNPHQSYAPVRSGTMASWFVDGSSYMSAVADAMEGAVEEIFIADWWLSPEIYLKRPPLDGHYWRLDQLLLRKAEQGIKIFVLLYKEVELALGINSYYSKQRLVSLHENIKVLRHPDHARAGVLFWAHHEKLVIVDQTYAFVGGIDLCYGRWDDHRHRLTDLGSIFPTSFTLAAPRKISTVVEHSILTLMNQSKDILAATTGGMSPDNSENHQSVPTIELKESPNGIELRQIQEQEETEDKQIIHESTKVIQSSSNTKIVQETIRLTQSEGADDSLAVEYREDVENFQNIERMVPGSPESLRVSKSLLKTAEKLRRSAENLQKVADVVEELADNLQGPSSQLPEPPENTPSAQLITSEKVQVVKALASPGEVSNATKKQLVMSPNPKKKIDAEEITEHTKRNTPEMERKNMLGKLKENVRTKGRDILSRMTSTITNETVGQEAPDTTDFGGQVEEEEEDVGLDGQAKLWIGKDYTNFILKDFVELNAPFNDLVDRTTTPRMPWHDIATLVIGHTARDAARHFIQRWNSVKLEKARENNGYPYIMPKSYVDMRIDENFFPKNKMATSRVTCQMIRSVSQWSCGYIEAENFEQSIHEAYVQTIIKAQHYIYIENQFFISTTYADQNVKNQITEILSKRILRAHREKKVFRVFIILPLLPGFEGDVGGASGNSLRIITHWNYASICRGKNSLIQKLRDMGIRNPEDYVSFHSLRTHATLNGSLVSELIYVHSKLLIADDKTVICGSANINDRSLLGKRDSEVAVIITDESFEDGKMNGESYPCGIFAGSLRKRLFSEHLGLLDHRHRRIDINDPITSSFWHGQWRAISQRNTELYDEIFRCIPNDNITTLAQIKRYQEDNPSLCRIDPEAAEQKVLGIQGFLVDLPLKFLESENLIPPGTSREGIMPTSLWI